MSVMCICSRAFVLAAALCQGNCHLQLYLAVTYWKLLVLGMYSLLLHFFDDLNVTSCIGEYLLLAFYCTSIASILSLKVMCFSVYKIIHKSQMETWHKLRTEYCCLFSQ